MKLSVAIGERTGFTESGQPKLGTLKKPKRETTWAKLVAGLSKFKTTDDKGGVGFLVGGWFEGNRRVADALKRRQLVILDLDYADPWDDPDSLTQGLRDRGIACFLHSTWSHTPDEPRYRLLIPLDEEITREQYEPVARRLAEYVSIDAVDNASYKWNQLMYLPAHPEGVEPVFLELEGAPAGVLSLLDTYEDWQDFAEYPRAQRDSEERPEAVLKAKNPFEAPGVIGAFNRVYSVTHAIQEYGLPYEPASDSEGQRWMYTHGEGNPGALVYPGYDSEAAFLYSNHTDDPAAGNNTAFDLCRIHLYGELDQGYDGPIGKAPSQKAMQARAMEDHAVAHELAAEDFEDLGPGESEPKKKKQKRDFAYFEDRIAHIGDRKDADNILTQLAAERLDPVDESVIVKELHATYPGGQKPTLKALQDSIKTKRQLISRGAGEDPSDIEQEILQEVLDEHFNGGEYLRRNGKQFWHYRHGVWVRVEDEWVRGCLNQTVIRVRKERPQDREAIVAAIGESRTSSITASLWQMFCSNLTRAMGEDTDPMGLLKDKPPVINCLNGEIRFRRDGTYKLTPHHPELFLTAQIPVDFDPKAKCPEWDRFCRLIFHDSVDPEEMQRHLEELCGYIIQPTRWLRSWVLFHGPTAAGKTTIGRVLNEMLGATVANASMERYGGQNDHAEAYLLGKLLLLDEDFRTGGLLPDHFLKKVSETKRMTGNPKGKDEFEFLCRSIPMIISNHWPPTRDSSDAIRERAMVWDLQHSIPREERSDARQAKLWKEELAGILARFVEGFSRLRARGDWDTPAECEEARSRWVNHSNSVALFMSDVVVRTPGKSMKCSELYHAYETWMQMNMRGQRMKGRNSFYEAAESLGLKRKHSNKGDSFVGVTLKRGMEEW